MPDSLRVCSRSQYVSRLPVVKVAEMLHLRKTMLPTMSTLTLTKKLKRNSMRAVRAVRVKVKVMRALSRNFAH